MIKALMPAARARSKACAPGRLAITTFTRAFKVPAPMASKIACKLEPTPETNTPRLSGLGAVTRLSIAQLWGLASGPFKRGPKAPALVETPLWPVVGVAQALP